MFTNKIKNVSIKLLKFSCFTHMLIVDIMSKEFYIEITTV